MAKTNDKKPGEWTRAELEETIDVNERMARACEYDMVDLPNRIARCEERIEDQRRMIEMYKDLAESAPEKIVRCRTTNERLREELAKINKAATEKKLSATKQMEQSVNELVNRIAAGDLTAVPELKKLLGQK